MEHIKLYKILVSIFVIISTVQAADIELSTYVDKNQLARHETVKYTIEIKGARNVEVPRPNFENFQVRSGPSQSSQIQIINGEMSVNKTVSWWLSPAKSGKIEIPPVKLQYKGNTYTSNKITLTVFEQKNDNNKAVNNRDDDKNGLVFFVGEH